MERVEKILGEMTARHLIRQVNTLVKSRATLADIPFEGDDRYNVKVVDVTDLQATIVVDYLLQIYRTNKNNALDALSLLADVVVSSGTLTRGIFAGLYIVLEDINNRSRENHIKITPESVNFFIPEQRLIGGIMNEDAVEFDLYVRVVFTANRH